MPAPAKKALTEADIAAMAASGIAPAAVVLAAAPAAAAATEAAPAAAPAAPAEGAPAAAPAAEAAPAAVAAAPAANADVVTFLQGQVAAKDAAILAANLELTGLKAKVADNEASINGLKAIAAASISNMRVALGGTKTDLSALSATELLAQHAAAKTDFETKFKVGGVAAVDAADPKAGKDDANVSAEEKARLQRFLG